MLLYPRLLANSWDEVAEPIKRMHGAPSSVHARGCFRVVHGRHPLARILARLWRLPVPGDAAPVQLVVTAEPAGECWRRTVNGRRFETRQYAAAHSLLGEQFGALEFRFQLVPVDGSLVYVQREAAVVLGPVRVAIPASWAPRVVAREDPAGLLGIKVEVRILLPGIGALISYEGLVHIEETAP